MTITPTSVLNVARSQINYHETPVNNTKYGAWYHMNGEAWCAIFQSWVFAQVGALPLIGGKQSYTPTFADWFRGRGQWGHVPRVGALVFFAWPGQEGGRISHVGIVEGVNADGSFYTIEGNTTDSPDPAIQRDGGGVARVRRTMFAVAGFGYPSYAASPSLVKPKGRALLKRGSTGADVKYLQGKLGLTKDGVFGPKTEAAVRALQAKHHLTVDGQVGTETWKVIG